jgi:hypothetical protein
MKRKLLKILPAVCAVLLLSTSVLAIPPGIGGGGSGDMAKSTYDTEQRLLQMVRIVLPGMLRLV